MPEVTLADYTGYILLELTKAREMADAYSREVAERYRNDPVLQHFSTPRFKIPKMELTIPVLISGARYSQVIDFVMPIRDFEKLVLSAVNDVVRTVNLSNAPVVSVVAPIKLDMGTVFAPASLVVRGKRASRELGVDNSLRASIEAFFIALAEHEDLSQPDSLIEFHWRNIFSQALKTAKLMDAYTRANPSDALFHKSLASLAAPIRSAIVVSKTTISNLLVSPETNNVKNGSNESSVFTIKAEVLEEGFFIKSIRDDMTGEVRQVVEFE